NRSSRGNEALNAFHETPSPTGFSGPGRDGRKFSPRFLELLITVLERLQELIVAHAGQTLQGIVDEAVHVAFATTALIRLAVVALVEGRQQPLQLGTHSGKAALRMASALSLGIWPCQRGILSRSVCKVAATFSFSAASGKSGC